MSADLPNASVQSANDDDDYFVTDMEVSQPGPANDTTNKCDLELLQFLEDN